MSIPLYAMGEYIHKSSELNSYKNTKTKIITISSKFRIQSHNEFDRVIHL